MARRHVAGEAAEEEAEALEGEAAEIVAAVEAEAGDVAGGERRQAPAMEAREGAVDVGEAGPGQHALGGDVAELLAQGGQQFRLEAVGGRSEEHTSELQSLMRISYAVFCLKKKNKSNNIDIHTTAEDTRDNETR